MDFEYARRVMVDSQVRPNDVTDISIQTALLSAPREEFLPSTFRQQAYVERELNYADGRSLVTARDFAKLLSIAEPSKTDLVMDVACGGGYSTAVLAQLCEMVVAVEPTEALAEQAQAAWSDQDLDNAVVISTDPTNGAKDQGPFDLIFIASAVEHVPEALLSQLKDGGRLATFLRQDGVSKGVLISRSNQNISCTAYFDATASHVLPGFEAPKSFSF